MADQGGNSGLVREYRKGNWTVSETMVLIEAKRMDDERRMKRMMSSSESEGRSSGKPAELRWKWVEDYCWRKGCLRSQNQCNDKWDNLMRDYKKVREYERRIAERGGGGGGGDGGGDHGGKMSYWNLEKNERKEKNLPSNMLLQIYEALVEVVERKGSSSSSSAAAAPHHQRLLNIGGGVGGGGLTTAAPAGGSASITPHLTPPDVVERVPAQQVCSLPPLLQHHTVASPPPPPPPISVFPPPPLPPPPQSSPQAQLPPPPLGLPCSHPMPTVDSDTSEHSDSPAKRRRRGGGGEGTSTGGTATASPSTSAHEVGTAISRSASIIVEAIQACEEREERRHKELLSIHERRLRIEESKSEINRQGINGLVDAINKLANSILALASHKSTPK